MPPSKQQLAKVTDGNQENRSKCIRKNHLAMLIMRRNDFRGVVNVVIGLKCIAFLAGLSLYYCRDSCSNIGPSTPGFD